MIAEREWRRRRVGGLWNDLDPGTGLSLFLSTVDEPANRSDVAPFPFQADVFYPVAATRSVNGDVAIYVNGNALFDQTTASTGVIRHDTTGRTLIGGPILSS